MTSLEIAYPRSCSKLIDNLRILPSAIFLFSESGAAFCLSIFKSIYLIPGHQ
jgi:hypothetical protein